MQQIIDGLLYDTTKAEKLGERNNSEMDIDRNGYACSVGWDESLFRTNKGRFFLCGIGSEGTEWYTLPPAGPQLKVRPISEDEAKKWVELYCPAKVFLRIWPANVSDA